MSDNKATITCQDDRLMVSGDLNFQTVMSLQQQSSPLLLQCSELKFDFSNVNSTNSAGLALLLEWVKYAKANGKGISFYQLPNQLNSIIALSGLTSILH